MGQSITPTNTEEESARTRPDALSAAQSFLFLVLDVERPLSGGARYSLQDVDEVVLGRGTARHARRETRDGVRRLHVEMPSPVLSSAHARLRRTADGWSLEDLHSRNGTYLQGEPLGHEIAPLGPRDFFEVGRIFLAVRELPGRPNEAWPDLDSAELDPARPGVHTLLPPMAGRFEKLRRVAQSNVTILLWGETGTGKELLTRAVHALSGRKGPFVAVNCSTLMEGLAESQLFGHVRGAFSGAIADSVGLVRAANGGTLLLDEVGDLSRAAQGTLLRVLQEREVIPVGSSRATAIDVRFVATSPRPLDPAHRRDQFRSDLFARLSGFVHEMTPLRERREDMGLLLAAILRRAGITEANRPRLSPAMGLAMLSHDWHLNIRELDQVVVRSWLLAEDGLLDETQIPEGAPDEGDEGKSPSRAAAAKPALSSADDETRLQLVEALHQAGGNVSAAARALGKGRVQFHRQMRRLSIDPRRFRGPG